MYAGRVAESGAVDPLFHDPRHPYTRLLFAATPDISAGEASVDPWRAARAWTGRSMGVRSSRGATTRSSPARCRRPRCWMVGGTPGCLPPERRVVRTAGRSGGCAMNDAVAARCPPEGTLLLDVHDLVVQYPVRRGLTAVLRREPRKDGLGGRRRLALGPPGRDARADRRVGLREDLDGAGDPAHGRDDLRHDRGRRSRHHAPVVQGAPPDPPDDPDGVPGPVRVARPAVPCPPGRSRNRC